MESDEIDLVELVKNLWKKNYGLFYLPSFVPPLRQAMLLQLKSNGHRQRSLQLPRSTELGKLLSVRAEYARIIGDNDFSTGGLSNSLYGQFKHFLLSNDLKENSCHNQV